MNTSASPATASSAFGTGALGVVLVLFILTVLFNIKLPFIKNDRVALIVLVVVGMAMCTSGGIGRSLDLYGWLHPITLIGTVLGILILAITALTLAGVRLPPITSDRAAFIAVAGTAITKIAVMSIGRTIS